MFCGINFFQVRPTFRKSFSFTEWKAKNITPTFLLSSFLCPLPKISQHNISVIFCPHVNSFRANISYIIISLLRYKRYKNEKTWHNSTNEQNKNYISNHILSLRSSLSACTTYGQSRPPPTDALIMYTGWMSRRNDGWTDRWIIALIVIA